MSPRFEYQNQNKPHDDEEQEEDALPSTNVLLVLCCNIQILRSLLHVYRSLFHIVLDRVQNRPLVDDEIRQIFEDLGQRSDRFGDFRNLS